MQNGKYKMMTDKSMKKMMDGKSKARKAKSRGKKK